MPLHRMENGVKVDMTPEEEAAHLADQAVLTAAINSTQWARNRMKAYLSFGEQLDDLYHLGYDGWKAKITAVKELYPKPE